jgi:hypothetical protein
MCGPGLLALGPGGGGQLGRELVAARRAVLVILSLVGLGGLSQDLGDLRLELGQVRLARSAALAATLVPSRATTPRRTRPAAAHSRNDSTRKPRSS